MSSQDIERAHYLRKIFEKMLDKADPEQSFKDRLEEAKKKMDDKLGTSKWRDEMKFDSEDPMPHQEAKPFYMRVAMVGDEEGLGDKGSEPPEEEERPGHELKEKLMCHISKILDRLL